MNAQITSDSQSLHLLTHGAKAHSRLGRNHPGLFASLGFTALLLASAPALAQVAPNLGTAAPYTVLGTNVAAAVGTVTCTNTGPGSTINGQVGTSFTSITNTLCTISGPIITSIPGGVRTDFINALAAVAVQNPTVCAVDTIPLATTTLGPGVYCSAAGTTLGAGVIITLSGTATDVWIFRVGTTLGALALTNAQVVMGGTANPCNVYWTTSQAATMTDSAFVGTVLSGDAVTMTRGSWVGGRALATTDVTITDAAPLTGGCAVAGAAVAPGSGVPTLSEWAMVMLAALLAIAGFAAMRRKTR